MTARHRNTSRHEMQEGDDNICKIKLCDERFDALFKGLGSRPTWAYYALLILLILGCYAFIEETVRGVRELLLQTRATVITNTQKLTAIDDLKTSMSDVKTDIANLQKSNTAIKASLLSHDKTFQKFFERGMYNDSRAHDCGPTGLADIDRKIADKTEIPVWYPVCSPCPSLLTVSK